MRIIKGIAASSGIAIAKAYHLSSPDLLFERTTIRNPELEIERLMNALDFSKKELKKIKNQTEKKLNNELAKIFSAHILFLNDPELINPIIAKIKTEKINAEAALYETANRFIDMFINM